MSGWWDSSMRRPTRDAKHRWFLGVLVVAVCFSGPSWAADKVKVVASFSILADLVKNVGGDHVEVTTLVGANGDPHVFEPSPADASLITNAKMVVVNGLGLEGWLNRLITASNKKVLVVVATQGVTPRTIEDEGSRYDPHAWQAVSNAEIYAKNIRDALILADRTNKADYIDNCDAYLARLTALDREIRDTVTTIPPSRRRVLTDHDAFGYFSASYGVAFLALQGVSTDAEPSAMDVASVIRQIKEKKVSAVFLENIVNPAQLNRIAEETGIKIGGILYSDALTEAGGQAPTYIDLMNHNLKTLSDALKS